MSAINMQSKSLSIVIATVSAPSKWELPVVIRPELRAKMINNNRLVDCVPIKFQLMFARVFHIYLCQNKTEKRARAREIRPGQANGLKRTPDDRKRKQSFSVSVFLVCLLFFAARNGD